MEFDRMLRHFIIGMALLGLSGLSAIAQEARDYVIISMSDVEVGYLQVRGTKSDINVVYSVSDNGRGPKTTENISLDKDGLPLKWQLSGEGYGGGEVQDRFWLEQGNAFWVGSSESGSSSQAQGKSYVPIAVSPWALAHYARHAALKAGDWFDVLPSGRVRARKLDSYVFGEGEQAISADLFVLEGLSLSPEYVLLDQDGELFASIDSYVVVRKGYESSNEQLRSIYADQTLRLREELSQRLAHRPEDPWLVTNVRIFDPVSLTFSELSTVRVFEDRIIDVSAGPPSRISDDQWVVDGAGSILMSGLVDMHFHEMNNHGFARLAAGITTGRDMGGYNAALLKEIRARRLETSDGPRVVPAGLIEGKSPWTANIGIVAETPEEALDAVHWYADRGYSFIKIYNSLPHEWVKDVAAEAHALGMKVLGHVPAFTTADQMIEQGYDEISHLNQLMLQYVLGDGDDTRTSFRLTGMRRFAHVDLRAEPVQRTIALMKAHGVGLDATASAMVRLNTQRDGQVSAGDALYLDHMPIIFQRGRRGTFLNIPDEVADREHFSARDKMLELLAMLYDEGITLWPGSDDGVAYTLQHELALYGEAGIPITEVLKMASYDTINYLGLGNELGTIEPGKLADFILVPESLAGDLTQLRNVSMVVKDGTIYFPEDIYDALGIRPFHPAPELIRVSSAQVE